MWSIINQKRPNVKNFDAQNTISPDTFNNYFTNVAHDLAGLIPPTNLTPSDLMPDFTPPPTPFLFREVSFNEVRDIIDGLKNKNSKDIFGLNVKLIKSVKNQIISPLTKLINSCIRESIFPNILKEALVTPIFKRGNRNLPESYRPIPLLPVFSKIYEKCIAIQITNYFISNNYFTDCQFGFRKGRNTTLAIADLTSYILNSFNEGSVCSSLFCDLSKAFDCVSHE